MVDSLRGVAKKLIATLVREAIASSICPTSMGFGGGTDRNSLTSIVSSRSNQGRCLHRVDKTLVLVAVVMSTLSRIESNTSSVSMLSLSSSSDF
jgi:hypothetical protein